MEENITDNTNQGEQVAKLWIAKRYVDIKKELGDKGCLNEDVLHSTFEALISISGKSIIHNLDHYFRRAYRLNRIKEENRLSKKLNIRIL